MATNKPRCAKTLRKGGPWQFYEAQCDRAGTVREDGKLWCKQHAPSNVAERESASEKRRIAKSVEYQRACEIERIQARIVSAVVDGDGIDTTALNNLRAQYRALENER